MIVSIDLLYLCDFVKKRRPKNPPKNKKEKDWLVFSHLPTDYFQTWYDDRVYWTLHFVSSLDDLDLHSMLNQFVQLYERLKTSAESLLIHMSIIMDLGNELCSSVPAAILHGKNLLSLTLHANFSITFVHTFHTYRHCWLPFYTAFIYLNLAWGSQGQHKIKPIGFIFSHTFHLIRMKYDEVLSNSSWTSWDCVWVRFVKTREITPVLQTA